MCNNRVLLKRYMVSSGFTLIEMMLVLLLMGIIGAALAPLLRGPSQSQPLKDFVQHFEQLANFAFERALLTGKTHRITADIKNRQMFVEEQVLPKPGGKPDVFTKVKNPLAAFSWTSQLIIQKFIIEGFDEMKRFTNKPTSMVWFYLIPNGMGQQVQIEAVLTGRRTIKPRRVRLSLNPFTAQLSVGYE